MTKENVRIAVRDAQDSQTVAFMDNSAKQAIHFKHADLTRFFEGDSTVLQMTIDKEHELASHVRAGAKLSFTYKNKDYWLNIMNARDVSRQRELTAFSLSLELNKEQMGPYSADKAMTFQEYLNIIDSERTLVIGINEIANKRITTEWEGNQSKLGRIYSLANKMDAEIAFETILNDDYSLKSQIINIYQKNDGTHQGIGQDKSNVILRVGQDLKLINREESLDDFYSGIMAKGKDGLTIANYEIEEKDSDGNILFCSYKVAKPDFSDVRKIYAPQARDRYPSKINPKNDGYLIEDKGDTDYSTVASLAGYMLSELKKNSKLYVNYETEGHFDSDPGDTFSLEDTIHYDPPLYLEARVYEQTESLILGNYSSDKTTFSNFVEKQSEIDDSLLSRVQALIDANKKYEYQLLSSSGVVFKNGQGGTTLTARILDGINDVTSNFSIQWYKNQEAASEGQSITVTATEVDETAVFRYEAKDSNDNVRGGAEVTVTNIDDGEPGQQGEPGVNGEPTGVTIANEPPAEPYDGMIWKNSSADNDYQFGQNYIWNQVINSWEIDTITANAFVAKTFKGFTIEGSEFISAFDREATSVGDVWIRGTTTIKDGQTTISWERYMKATGQIIENGLDSIQPGIMFGRTVDYQTGTTTGQYDLSSNGIRFMNIVGGQYYSGNLNAETAYDTDWVTLPVLKGSGSIKVRRYMKRIMLWFDSYIWNGNGTNAPNDAVIALPTEFQTGRMQMLEVPVWSGTPGMSDRYQLNADGKLYKLSNNSKTVSFRTFTEIF